MKDFERELNEALVATLASVQKYEELSLRSISDVTITAAEAHLIEAIAQAGDTVPLSTLSVSLGVAPSTTTVAVKRLESKGLVTKSACAEDGRRTLVSLTELGRKVDRAHTLFHRRMVRHMAGELSDSEQNVLLGAVRRLNSFFRVRTERAGHSDMPAHGGGGL